MLRRAVSVCATPVDGRLRLRAVDGARSRASAGRPADRRDALLSSCGEARRGRHPIRFSRSAKRNGSSAGRGRRSRRGATHRASYRITRHHCRRCRSTARDRRHWRRRRLAARVQTLMPHDARAALIRGVGGPRWRRQRLRCRGARRAARPRPVAARDCDAGRPTGLALEHTPAGAERDALLDRIVGCRRRCRCARHSCSSLRSSMRRAPARSTRGARALGDDGGRAELRPADHDGCVGQRGSRVVRSGVGRRAGKDLRGALRGDVCPSRAAALAGADSRVALSGRRARRWGRGAGRRSTSPPSTRFRMRISTSRSRRSGRRRPPRSMACRALRCRRAPRRPRRGSSPRAIRMWSSTSSD